MGSRCASQDRNVSNCRKGKKLENPFLLKLGGNVTSMREFTALSSSEAIKVLACPS